MATSFLSKVLILVYFIDHDDIKGWNFTGGRIDQAHHDGRAKLALEEAFQFDLAIAAALNMTDPADTLIIVTADHSHTMTINGYPDRGNDILGMFVYFACMNVTLIVRFHLVVDI